MRRGSTFSDHYASRGLSLGQRPMGTHPADQAQSEQPLRPRFATRLATSRPPVQNRHRAEVSMLSATGLSRQRRVLERKRQLPWPTLRKTVARPTGKSAYADIFGESLHGRCKRFVRLPLVVLHVPRVYLLCTWRGTVQVSGLICLAGNGGREGSRPAAPQARWAQAHPRYTAGTSAHGAAGRRPAVPAARWRVPRVTRRWAQSPRWCRGRRRGPGRGWRGRAGSCGACR